MIPFYFKIQWNLYRCLNKSSRSHLKMESDEETAADAVASLLVQKKLKKEKNIRVGKIFAGEENLSRLAWDASTRTKIWRHINTFLLPRLY